MIVIKNKANYLDLGLKVFCLFIGTSAASNATNVPDSKYFDFQDAAYSNTVRKGLPIFTRASPDNDFLTMSNDDYSGACVYFYGNGNDPEMNSVGVPISQLDPLNPVNSLAAVDIPSGIPYYSRYITQDKYKAIFNDISANGATSNAIKMFYLEARVMFPIKSLYSTKPTYSTLPHFCEYANSMDSHPVESSKNKTFIGNTTTPPATTTDGSYLALKSLSGTENIFNFLFMSDNTIRMEMKSQYWWKNALQWQQVFYPSFDGITYNGDNSNNYDLNYFHGPDASLAYKVSKAAIDNNGQKAIGNYAHLNLVYDLKRNLTNYDGTASEFATPVDNYSTSPAYPTGTGAFYSGVKINDFPIGRTNSSPSTNSSTCANTSTQTCPNTWQNSYAAGQHGSGLRMGIAFMYDTTSTITTLSAGTTAPPNTTAPDTCGSLPKNPQVNNYYADITVSGSTPKAQDNATKFTFNFIVNIFDERYEYIDQTPKGISVASTFKNLIVDQATGIQMYRASLADLIDYNNFMIGSFHYNPFKRTGNFTGINGNPFTGIRKDLLAPTNGISPMRKLITTLVNQGVLPMPPTGCSATTIPAPISVTSPIPDAYYAYILNHLYVTATSTGFETGGLADLSFTLRGFSLTGSNN